MKYCKNCDQMVDPQKDFNGILFIILLILGVIPGVLYLEYYLMFKDETCPICDSTNWGPRPDEESNELESSSTSSSNHNSNSGSVANRIDNWIEENKVTLLGIVMGIGLILILYDFLYV